MSCRKIKKPIGLKEVQSVIELICKNSQMHKKSAIKPNHMIINLDAGSGRTTLVEYITDMFEEYGILSFKSGIDDYKEFELDGSLTQLGTVISEIETAADYANEFTGIIAVGVSELANPMNERQCTEFIAKFKGICNSAFVIFFVHSKPTKNEEQFIKKLISNIGCIDNIVVSEYTTEELCSIIEHLIEQHGISIENYDVVHKLILDIVELYEITNVKGAIYMAKRVIKMADFSCFKPVISNKQLKTVLSSRKEWR